MNEQLPSLASVEADFFGVLLSFHKKIMTLLRESSLDEERLKVVSDRVKALLDDAIADVKATKQVNVADRLDAVYQEAKRLVDEDDKKARPKTRRAVNRKNKR